VSRRTKHELSFNSSSDSIEIKTDNSNGYGETPFVSIVFDAHAGMSGERGWAEIKFENSEDLQELIDLLELAKKELL